MTLIWETNISKYSSRTRGRFYTILRPIVQHPTIQVLAGRGRTLLNLDIVFHDGSKLNGGEILVGDRDRVTLIGYTYEYWRPSEFFFAYEMEVEPESSSGAGPETQRIATQLKKPHCHLHVGAKKEIADLLEDFPSELREHDGPHYGTYPVCLDYILAVIIVNYFPEQEVVLGRLDLPDFLIQRLKSEYPCSS